jgi:acyl-CoA thioesterase FadM
MDTKEFIFEKTVYLTDTNLFGNTYFARYFDWQGMAREAFFKRLIGDVNKFMQSRIKLVTIEAHIKYHHEVTLYDEVIIKVKAENIKVATVDLVFTYLNKKTNQLVAVGRQKIGFVHPTGQVIPVPKELIEGWNNLQR